MKSNILIVFILLVLASCSNSKNIQKTVLKRYTHAIPTKEISEDSAVIVVVPEVLPNTETKVEKSKTVYDFTNEGQKEYLKILGEKSKDDISKFNDGVNQKFLSQKTENEALDITEKKLHIVFSISQKDLYSLFPAKFSLGDRIEYLKLTLSIIDPDNSIYKFSDWNRFNTQFGQYNIGARSFANTKSININPSIPFTAGAGGALTLGSYDDSSTLTESDSLKIGRAHV